jgi:hypothetical protein
MPINFVRTVPVQEPDVQPWGTSATVEGSEGDQLLLVGQPR